MNFKSIAFDVDGTLVHQTGEKEDMPRHEIIDLFRWFEEQGWVMYIWSQGGVEYANSFAIKLGLQAHIIEKGIITPDIAVDDENCDLGVVNIKVNPPKYSRTHCPQELHQPFNSSATEDFFRLNMKDRHNI